MNDRWHCSNDIQPKKPKSAGDEEIMTTAQADKDKDYYTNRCDGLDPQVDALVYDLYGLSPDEIKIVVGVAKANT
jgi:hypothetical protein